MKKLEDTFIQGMYYSDEVVEKAISENTLLNLDLDMTNLCNLRCIYCDKVNIGESHSRKENELNLDESINIIKQAKELGCKNLQFMGAGEPTLDTNFWEIIKYADKNDILSVVYTNGTRISEGFAKKLFKLNTSVILKFNTFNPENQDKLVGVNGYYLRVMESLSTLMDAGFNKTTPPRLAIDCVATPINLPEVKELYQYCRENNISPQFSGLIPHGEALQRKLVVGREEYKKLYKQIKTYDKTIGYDYPEQIPFLGGFECRQIKYGMYVDIQGNVWECNAGNLKVGNIRDSKLKDLWNSTKAKEFRKSWKMGNCHVREKYWKNDKK